MEQDNTGALIALWLMSLGLAYLAGWYRLRFTITKPSKDTA